jgi:hypothetical protein
MFCRGQLADYCQDAGVPPSGVAQASVSTGDATAVASVSMLCDETGEDAGEATGEVNGDASGVAHPADAPASAASWFPVPPCATATTVPLPTTNAKKTTRRIRRM